MLQLEHALERILALMPSGAAERIPLAQAAGRIAAGTISAPIDLPPFDNSSMDGYAVRAEDVAAAVPGKPVALKLAGKVAAGEVFHGEVTRGTAVRLFTGSPLPHGADAIVMQEDTRIEPDRPGEVLVLEPARPWENVRFHGEDVRKGSTVLETGDRLTIGRVSLLSALGISEVSVSARPKVALLATGSELKEVGQPIGPGQIYESNRSGLRCLVEAAGGVASAFPVVPDDPNATHAALKAAFLTNDVVISCGGVSVGEMDFVKSAFEAMGGRLDFWKIAIKPGRPFVFGQLGSRFLFGLPGNPVSALVTFLMLVRPALLKRQSARDLSLPTIPGTLVEPLENPGERRHFIRVRVDARGEVRSSGTQASHIISAVAEANGLVDVPPGTKLAAGTSVSVLRWEL